MNVPFMNNNTKALRYECTIKIWMYPSWIIIQKH